jgi:hypothetical protein
MAASSTPQTGKQKTEETMKENKDKSKQDQEAMGHFAEKAGETASRAGHAVQDAASCAAQKVKDTAAAVGEKAQDFSATAKEKADEALATVGQKMTSLAGTIRQQAPQQGIAASTASVVADNLQAGGHYLEEHGLGDMLDDLGGLVRRYPGYSLLAGFGVGCLLGTVLKRR